MITPIHAEAAFASSPRYELTEEGLAGLAASGDESAFAKLLALLEPELRAYVGRRMPRHLRSRLQIGEVLQEVRIALHSAVRRFQPGGEGTLRKYVRGIAYNKTCDVVRNCVKERQKKQRVERLAEDLARVRRVRDPSALAAAREAGELVAAEIDRLPDGQREAAQLVLLKGWSYREAGERLNLTDDATRLRVKRACRILRPRLQELVA